MTRKAKRLIKLVAALAAVVVLGGLLTCALLESFGLLTGEDAPPLVTSETVYIILALTLLLPIAVVIMIVSSVKRRREVEATIEKMPELRYAEPEQPVEDRFFVRYDDDGLAIGAGNGESGEESEEQGEDGERFYMLCKTDRDMQSYVPPRYDDNLTLSELCERFRNFSASKLGLFYDISDIRRFIASLAVTHLIIMQGMSGTGKTSLAYAFGEFMKNKSVIVPIQPMWKERTDLIGYYNEFTKRFNETVLLQKMYEADYNDEMYVTVLDEMNIARVEYYFAEFLSLLELPNPESRYLDVVSDKWEKDPLLLRNGQLKLPTNMWFVGTANNDDSTFAISDKVYDRAMIMSLDRKSEPFAAEETTGVKLSESKWNSLVREAEEEYGITDRNERRIKRLDEYMITRYHITFGNRIMKQIRSYVPVYVSCGGKETDAIDDILSRKVLRKLESQNPVYVKNSSEELCTFIDELFGADVMPQCKEYVQRLSRTS